MFTAPMFIRKPKSKPKDMPSSINFRYTSPGKESPVSRDYRY